MKEQKYSYSQRIGKTTFIVNVKQSESAKKPLNTVFQDICKHEVLGDFFTDKSFNLENPQKYLDKLDPEGTGYRAKTRFARFYNLPELMAMFKEIADIKTADMLDLPVPKAVFHNISVKPSEIQKQMVAELAERAERVRNGMVDAKEDNMLKITNDGRKLALDQRLINPLLPDFEDSKLNACVDAMFETWERGSEKRLTQLFFCDLSTPKTTAPSMSMTTFDRS